MYIYVCTMYILRMFYRNGVLRDILYYRNGVLRDILYYRNGFLRDIYCTIGMVSYVTYTVL